MEETQDILDGSVETQGSGTRPGFLTVLCILTFVGAGLGILGGLIGLLSAANTEESFRQLDSMSGTNPFADAMAESIDYDKIARVQTWTTLLSLFASLACLAGALVMWKLKKFGFFIYVGGHVLALTGSFLSLTIMQEMEKMGGGLGLFSGIGMFGVIFTVLLSGGFIVMYGLNLKHLR